MCALGFLNQFNIFICVIDVSSDIGGSLKHFYSATTDLVEGQTSIAF